LRIAPNDDLDEVRYLADVGRTGADAMDQVEVMSAIILALAPIVVALLFAWLVHCAQRRGMASADRLLEGGLPDN
jgi:hypothetical protein